MYVTKRDGDRTKLNQRHKIKQKKRKKKRQTEHKGPQRAMKSWRGCIYDQWCKMRYETKTETQKDKEIKKNNQMIHKDPT